MTISVTMSNVGMGIYHENRELSNDELVCEGTYNIPIICCTYYTLSKATKQLNHHYIFMYVFYKVIYFLRNTLSYCQFLCFFLYKNFLNRIKSKLQHNVFASIPLLLFLLRGILIRKLIEL